MGVDIILAHSPERVDHGNKRYTPKSTNKLTGATDSASLVVGSAF